LSYPKTSLCLNYFIFFPFFNRKLMF